MIILVINSTAQYIRVVTLDRVILFFFLQFVWYSLFTQVIELQIVTNNSILLNIDFFSFKSFIKIMECKCSGNQGLIWNLWISLHFTYIMKGFITQVRYTSP